MSRRDSGKTQGHLWAWVSFKSWTRSLDGTKRTHGKARPQMGQPELGTWPGTVAPHRAGREVGGRLCLGVRVWRGTVELCPLTQLSECHQLGHCNSLD